MALVAYDNSDSSDFDDDEHEQTSAVTVDEEVGDKINTATQEPKLNGVNESVSNEQGSLFNRLPQPSSKKPQTIEQDDEFLLKKETNTTVKPKAKITVPSLSDFKDVESITPNKPKTINEKKSGLLSLLPQPRNSVKTVTKSLIPNVVAQKTNSVKKDILSAVKKNKVDQSLNMEYSDDSDNDEVQNDFFSINNPVELPEDVPVVTEEPVEVASNTQKLPRSIESYFKKDVVDNRAVEQPELDTTEYDTSSCVNGADAAPESSSNRLELDEEAIVKLCGSRGKRKRNREPIQLVDVDQQQVLAEARQWLLKGLAEDTGRRASASKRRGTEPTTQQRRKHQITYLAHQAKANETELQNQWANNRMSRRQTQSKYGF